MADLAAHDNVVGVTTNPTIFARAISGSDDYDAQLRDLAMRGADVHAALRDAGARPQRPLWASTSVKDPAYPGTRYVTDLIAPA